MSKKRERRERTQALLADREQVDAMLASIGSGMSLRDWCAIHEVVYSTVQVKLTTDEELRPLYEAARIRQAEAVLDEIKELEERLEGKGEPIDPRAAQVLIGSKQWRAERLNPKRYGQRSYQHVETVDQTKLHLEALRTLARPTARLLPAEEQPRALPKLDANVLDAVVVEQPEPVAATQQPPSAQPVTPT